MGLFPKWRPQKKKLHPQVEEVSPGVYQKKQKTVELVDILNDLEREEEINKRIKAQLKKKIDKPKSFGENPLMQLTTVTATMSTFIPRRPSSNERLERLGRFEKEINRATRIARQAQGKPIYDPLSGKPIYDPLSEE